MEGQAKQIFTLLEAPVEGRHDDPGAPRSATKGAAVDLDLGAPPGVTEDELHRRRRRIETKTRGELEGAIWEAIPDPRALQSQLRPGHRRGSGCTPHTGARRRQKERKEDEKCEYCAHGDALHIRDAIRNGTKPPAMLGGPTQKTRKSAANDVLSEPPMPAFLQTGEFYATLCAVIWAFAVILFRKSGDTASPVALNVFKNLVALLCLSLTLLALGRPIVDLHANSWSQLMLFVSGVLGIGIADTFFFASLNRLGAGRSAIVDCCYSPLVVLSSSIFLHEPRPWTLYVAILLMMLAILVGEWRPSERTDPTQERRIREGIVFGVLSMALMAVGISVAKPVLAESDSIQATLLRVLGGMSFLSLYLFRSGPRGDVLRMLRPNPGWRFALPGAFLGSYISMILWIMGMKYTHTTTAAILNQLSTLFVMILAVFFLRESFGPRKLVALALGVAAGIVVVF
jgi:drug/metabolite transporter (DMT)-like permease